jgi:predicted MPP superfamily phosphohydrolase
MSRVTQIAVFMLVFFSLLGGLHYFFWARLIRDTALPASWARAATGLLVALMLSIPAAFILGRLLNQRLAGLSWVAYVWMGLFWLLLMGLVSGELVKLGVALVAGLSGAPLDDSRRQLLARAVAGTASAFAAGAGALGVRAVLGPVQVREVAVKLAKLPRALDGFRIVAISDVHLGPTIGADFMADVVRRVNALAPDLVAVVGDLVDGSVEELREAAAPLAGLQSKHGSYFVTGNHEWYSGAVEWMAHLRTLGLRTLENERVPVAGPEGFELAGTHDLTGRTFGLAQDLDRALGGRDPNRALVLLAHQPKTFAEAAKKGVDLQISGHTHGGQIWPFGWVVKLQQGFLAGLSKVGAAQLYVSRGTGYWGPPMRVGAPAEISCITLRSA